MAIRGFILLDWIMNLVWKKLESKITSRQLRKTTLTLHLSHWGANTNASWAPVILSTSVPADFFQLDF